jgi:type III pantothenate kinase
MINSSYNILAIEVGSSRVKLGWFPAAGACASEKPAGNLPIAAPLLPEPSEVFWIDHRRDTDEWIAEVDARLTELPIAANTICVIAAVNSKVAAELQERALAKHEWARTVRLQHSDIPIQANVKEPNRVGMDRLLNALAANHRRHPKSSVIVVDIGTAMTVNFITADGVFQGGAILAGPITSLAALHHATSSLPLLGNEAIEAPPPVVGKNTEEAMAAGAFWGTVGAARGFIEGIAATYDERPHVIVTGGAARGVWLWILNAGGKPATYIPDLVLSGIRLAAERFLKP